MAKGVASYFLSFEILAFGRFSLKTRFHNLARRLCCLIWHAYQLLWGKLIPEEKSIPSLAFNGKFKLALGWVLSL